MNYEKPTIQLTSEPMPDLATISHSGFHCDPESIA